MGGRAPTRPPVFPYLSSKKERGDGTIRRMYVNVHVRTVQHNGEDKTELELEEWGVKAFKHPEMTEEETARVLLMDWGMDTVTAAVVRLEWHYEPVVVPGEAEC